MDKIGSFYEQGTDDVRPDLFNEVAEKIAKSFATVEKYETDRGTKENRSGITSTQLRRLFDEVKHYETLIDDDSPETWKEQYPYIKMIRAKTRYTVARAKRRDAKNAKYYDNLSLFISEGIGLIQKAKDYHVFVSLFEAVYGFYYENRPDLKN